jgi:hypothetical protein
VNCFGGATLLISQRIDQLLNEFAA